MRLCSQLLCIHRKKRLATKGNRRRRLKRVIPTRSNSILCPNPTSSPIEIPLDLQINTLFRLPAKSILRFRCVSKLWSSITRSKDFRNQHMNITTSSAPPRILISFADACGNKLLLVSSPNPNPNATSSCVPYKDLNLLKIHGKDVYNSVRGLICVRSIQKISICNPSTRQVNVFPQIKFSDYNECIFPYPSYFFGYDPIEDQFKILAVDNWTWRLEHKVMVLGGREKEAWREAPCVAYPHVAYTLGLYMNGTIYYGALRTDIDHHNDSIIVSFDVRSETFNVIKVPNKIVPEDYANMWIAMWDPTDKTLINYGGKIGVVEKPRGDGSFRLWVVEDAAKEEWSTNTFHLPQSFVGLDFFNVMSTTFYNDEICLVPKELSDPFRIFYYNLKNNSMRSVVIEGLPVSELKRVKYLSVTVSEHCESLMLLEETDEKHHQDSELHFI